MKSHVDPRHKKRQQIVTGLFSLGFQDQPVSEDTTAVIKHKEEIDKIITKIAPEFPIDKINKVDLAILRLAVYELNFEKKAPPKVILDEAIELAKEYAGENSPAFVNGALGKLIE